MVIPTVRQFQLEFGQVLAANYGCFAPSSFTVC